MEAQEADGRCQGIISAMLAEHLPDLRPLFWVSVPPNLNGWSYFFSAALQSPQRDHVFEFRRESHPLQMAECAGLRVTRLMSDASAVAAGSRFLPRATTMILNSALLRLF